MTDKSRFESIFREYYPRLYYLALQFVGDEEAARDIVADSFWAAWKNRKNIDSEKTANYLYTCVKNKSIKQIANTKRTVAIGLCENSIPYDENEEKWKERERRYNEIEMEMEKMSPRTRFVLRQCYLEHHTYKEVAEMLGITTDGVKKHLMKAMAQLRAHFNIDKHK